MVSWSCTPEGLDPRGWVRDACILLNGWTGTATVSSIQSSPTTTTCTLTTNSLFHKFVLDVPLTLCKIEPAEVTRGDQVTLLMLSCDKNTKSRTKRYRVIALALRPSRRVLRAFERIGLVWDSEPFWALERIAVAWDFEPYIGDSDRSDMFTFAPTWFVEWQNIKIV